VMLIAALALDVGPAPTNLCKDPFGRMVTCFKAAPPNADTNPEVPTAANTRTGTAGRCYWTNRTADHVPG